jgi:alpha-mannosidase
MLDLRKIYSKEFYISVKEANEYLTKEFYTNINNTLPVVTAIGHTHIDIAWLWTISQTKEKAVRSFATVLELMKHYPEYKFMSSQPQLYKYIKEREPELYEEIKTKIKEKRWEADGAMWLEADCNIPSGESFVRQILFGTRFFREEFGVECKSLWLPDVFGYSAALPQILKKSNIKYFMTTKISWNQFNTVPNDTFLWRGIDGSEVFTYFVTTSDYNKGDGENITFTDKNNTTTYTGIINPNQVLGTWKRYQNKDINEETLMLFGYGDGGGGPTKEMLENAKRLSYGIPGCPRVQIGLEEDFFDRLYNRVIDNRDLPKWVGELYLEYHRGTYTSMGKNKRYNRKSEFLYQNAEMLSTLSTLLGEVYPTEELKQGWETILLNQFHDIIPGSSIKEVYEESEVQYKEAIASGEELIKNALESISSKIDLETRSVIVFNTMSYNRTDIVEVSIPEGENIFGIEDLQGNEVEVQWIDNKRKFIFFAEGIPSKGYKVYKLTDRENKVFTKNINMERNFENEFFKITFDDDFNIIDLFDKVNYRKVLKKNAKANVLQAFEDRPIQWENWDIDIYYKKKMWEVNDLQKVEVIEEGPIRYCIKLERSFCDSKIKQYIYFYKNIPRIDFKNCIDWKEKNILLKVAFPVDINSSRATYEIQYGNIERETHNNTSWDLAKFEVCGHKWADISEGGYGVSLINDCKYGYDIKDGVIRLTLLKSGKYPNPDADLGYHEFTYSIYPHKDTWKEAETQIMAYNLNVPMYSVIGEGHKGILEKEASFLQVSKDNCIVEVVKKAEDDASVIIRLYEYKNKREKVDMSFNKEIVAAYECNLMEDIIEQVACKNNTINFDLMPYEIKTFRIYFK